MTASRRRLVADQVRERFGVSQRRVSRALGLARSSLRYAAVVSDERAALARRIEALSGIHPRFGYRRIWVMLDREGWSVNKETVRRHWRRLGLKLAGKPAKIKPRRPHGQDANACHLRPSRGKDDVWAWDFIFDRASDGRSLKWLSLIDEYTRECLALEARRSMTAEEIRATLAEVAARRGGPPRRIRSDNGPEFAAEAVAGLHRLGRVVRRPGEPVAERLCGVVPRQAPRRVPGPRGVRGPGAGPGLGHALEGGVQHRTPAQFAGLTDTGGICRSLPEIHVHR
jgi:putative transposase